MAKISEVVKKLIRIKVLKEDVLQHIPLQETSCVSHLVCSLVKDITVFEDYYEFFDGLDDKPIKAGYEMLIKKILQLTEISGKKYTIEWKGAFDYKKPEDEPQITLSHGTIRSKFKLKYEGESVDSENLLKGLNAFIKACSPDEKRKLQMLQIFSDQTNCVWFVTKKQLEELCPIIHAEWEDFSDHYCEVTRAKTLKKKGSKGLLQLCKRSAKREWERLSNKTWKVYPAKKP